MSSIVAVAGGSGGLGRAIIDALKASSKYEPLILSRKSDDKLQEVIGVRILPANYTDVDSLVALLDDYKIDTVISTMNSLGDPTPELNLIKAATRAKTTHRFVPNIFSGFDYTEKHRAASPFAAAKLMVEDTLAKTDLEWTAFHNGIFLDYYAPGFPSYVMMFPSAVDVEANAAGLPGSGDYPVHFTHTSDIGKYVVAALELPKWEKKYFIVGDTKTWDQVVDLAERIKGVKFDVSYDSVEKMKQGSVTELPEHVKKYALFGGDAAKPFVQANLSLHGLWLAAGEMEYGTGSYLNKMFPEIKPVSLEEAMRKSFSKE